jgi:plasmid stability protein
MIINKALLDYGYSNFKLEILEYTSPEKALEKEQYYLDLLDETLSYNILRVAGSRLGHKTSEETKAKLRISRLGKSHSTETREKIKKALLSEIHPTRGKPGNSAFKGKIHSTETKDKMSAAKLGKANPNFGKSLSEEGRLKLSSIRGTAIEVYDIEIEEKSYYTSQAKAAAALSCSR